WRELADSLPVSCKLLNLEQDSDAVQAVVGGQPARHLVVTPRDLARFVETAAAQVRGQRGPQGAGLVVGVLDPRQGLQPPLDELARLVVVGGRARDVGADEQRERVQLWIAESQSD